MDEVEKDRLLPFRLHKAAQRGDVAQMRELIARGADASRPDEKGVTPLFYTANTGTVEGAKLLLEHGADINAAVPGGGIPLHSALLKKHTPLALFFIANGGDIHKTTIAGVTPLHMAARHGMTEVITRILDAGAKVNALDRKKLTPLHWALLGIVLNENDDPRCLRALFAAGADPRLGEEFNLQHLKYAEPETAKVLREELETLAARTEDQELRQYISHMLTQMDELSGQIKSPLLGLLHQEQEPGLDDWWRSTPIPIPFWDNLELPIIYHFQPSKDPTFMAEADAALANFLKKNKKDRLEATARLDEYCRLVCEATDFGDGGKLCAQMLSDKDRTTLWNYATPPKEVHVERRDRRNKAIYVHLDMECAWEEEHGLQLVFYRGEKLTRVSPQDGWLTDADALGTPEEDDAPAARR